MQLKEAFLSGLQKKIQEKTLTELGKEISVQKSNLSNIAKGKEVPKGQKMLEILILLKNKVEVAIDGKSYILNKKDIENKFERIKKAIMVFIEKVGVEEYGSLQAFSLIFTEKPNYVWQALHEARALDALHNIAKRLPGRPRFYIDGQEVEFHESARFKG